ncbi:MAG: hypothetical protein ACRDKI_00155 [Solirubrobacterales bacterium]
MNQLKALVRDRTLRRDIALIVFGVVLGAFLPDVRHGIADAFTSEPLSPAAQIARIERDAARDHYATGLRRLSLRGDGTQSLVVLLRYSPPKSTDWEKWKSDEVRIYDMTSENGSERWKLGFRFRPVSTFTPPIFGTAWRFSFDNSFSVGPDDRTAILGEFHENHADQSSARPVLIRWDHGSQEYTISSLLRGPLRIPVGKDSTGRAQFMRKVYTAPAALKNEFGAETLRVFGTGAVGIDKSENGQTLLLATPVGSAKFVLSGQCLEADGAAIDKWPCGHVRVKWTPSLFDRDGIAKAWHAQAGNSHGLG